MSEYDPWLNGEETVDGGRPEPEDPMLLRPVGEGCTCVVTHTPRTYIPALHHVIPESWGGPTVKTNLVMLCPNAHTSVHRLIDEYVRTKGLPPWETRRKFSSYIQMLAQAAWDGRPPNPRITSLDHNP